MKSTVKTTVTTKNDRTTTTKVRVFLNEKDEIVKTKLMNITIIKGNIKTVKTIDGMLKKTLTVIEDDNQILTVSTEKNGVAPRLYRVKKVLKLFDPKTQKIEKVEIGAKSNLGREHFDREGQLDRATLLALREVVLDLQEEQNITFIQALNIVMRMSNLLSGGLATREIAIMMGITIDEVTKIETRASTKLKTNALAKELNAEFKLENNSKIKIEKPLTNTEYFMEGTYIG